MQDTLPCRIMDDDESESGEDDEAEINDEIDHTYVGIDLQ